MNENKKPITGKTEGLRLQGDVCAQGKFGDLALRVQEAKSFIEECNIILENELYYDKNTNSNINIRDSFYVNSSISLPEKVNIKLSEEFLTYIRGIRAEKLRFVEHIENIEVTY